MATNSSGIADVAPQHSDTQSLEALRALVLARAPQRWTLVVHRSPDGDALGSALALALFLRKWYTRHLNRSVEIVVLSPTPVPAYYWWLPGAQTYLQEVGALSQEARTRWVRQTDVFVFVDFNDLSRLEDLGEAIAQALATTHEDGRPIAVLVDHHENPRVETDFRLWSPDAAATAQLMWQWLVTWDSSLIDREIATCIYTALMTDTGSFRFGTTTPEVHYLAARLLSYGVQPDLVYQKIYHTFSYHRLQFYGFCLLARLRYLPFFRCAYLVVSAEDLRRFRIGAGETEGLVNYTLTLQNVVLGALLIDRTQPHHTRPTIRLSLRSTGSLRVDELAVRYFNGGGHANAAGGVLHMPLTEAEAYFLDVLKREFPRWTQPITSSSD